MRLQGGWVAVQGSSVTVTNIVEVEGEHGGCCENGWLWWRLL